MFLAEKPAQLWFMSRISAVPNSILGMNEKILAVFLALLMQSLESPENFRPERRFEPYHYDGGAIPTSYQAKWWSTGLYIAHVSLIIRSRA